MIPAHLLNATIVFFKETNPMGSMGQPEKVLTEYGVSRCRADMTTENRMVEDGNFEQRARVFSMTVNETPPDVTTKTWVEVVTDYNGFKFLGQVASVAYSGLARNHSELRVVENPPGPSGSFRVVYQNG